MKEGLFFCQRIQDLRQDKDLSQEKMGEHLQCSRKTYGKYERGDKPIPGEVLIQLAYFHHVSIDYLLGKTQNPTPHFKKGAL